jgi:DNA-binding NarL/FixJ family response regulator
VRVVVADDHPLIREAIRRRLEAASDIELVGEAASGEGVLELLTGNDVPIDLAILDIQMAPLSGLETTEIIRARHPGTEVLILTGTAEPLVVLDGLRKGAKGYLLKHRDSQQLLNAVRLVAAGTIVIDPDLIEAVAAQMGGGPAEILTRREIELLQLVALGRTNGEISQTIYLSESSVKLGLTKIMTKLGANDRTSAVAEAFRLRLIE